MFGISPFGKVVVDNGASICLKKDAVDAAFDAARAGAKKIFNGRTNQEQAPKSLLDGEKTNPSGKISQYGAKLVYNSRSSSSPAGVVKIEVYFA